MHFVASADNHDIMSIKFYENEVPVMPDTKKDEDRSTIVPYASGAEPYRGSVENTNSKGRGRGNKLKILLSIQERVYRISIHRVRTGHGKPGKSWNLRISFSRPGKSWNLIAGP